MHRNLKQHGRNVPRGLYWRARFFRATAPLWRQLSRIESGALRDDIEAVAIENPIYIAGVPRAGSTLLTEILAHQRDVTTHRYSDFPNVFTPYWRNWLAERSGTRSSHLSERAHKDRIMVSNESPEAVEEVIWMHFFEQLHAPLRDQRLDKEADNLAFENFYSDHIRKLLLVRKAKRYLAKGNYNVARLPYILKLFPDARFIVPVRNPINQVASLVKQDHLFHRAHEEDPRVDLQLRMSGHFEFGPGHRPICLESETEARKIARLWSSGRSAEGWALYWNSIYSQLLDQLSHDSDLQVATMLVRYEDLCSKPEETLRKILAHARLDGPGADSAIGAHAARISEPEYYRPEFDDEELDSLLEITHNTRNRLGY
jgi:hypothetical protein